MTLISDDRSSHAPSRAGEGDRAGWFEPALLASCGTLFVVAVGLRAADVGIPNSDDLMRLVQVRDLLGGQPWYDLTQYRLGLAEGTAMHWSRLVDAPIAGIVRAAAAVTGSLEKAEAVARILWPALTFFLAMLALVTACVRTGRRAALLPVAVVGAFALWTTGAFASGALDHHNIQIALALWLLALLLPGSRPVAANAAAGATAVLMLAIGMEALPYVALAGALAATGFTIGSTGKDEARAFGLSLAVTTVAVFLATVGPGNWRNDTCDAFSAFHLVAATLGGAGLAAATYIRRGGLWRGLAVLAVGAVMLAVVTAAFPQCLENPLASLDPRLHEFWLEGVVETRSIGKLWMTDPFALPGLFALAVCAVVVTLFSLRKAGRDRRPLAVFLAFLAMGIAVTAWQQRGFVFATAFAILPLGFWIADIRSGMPARRSRTQTLALAGAWLLSVNLVWWMGAAYAAALFSGTPPLQQQAASVSPRDYCYTADLYETLQEEPAGVVLGATDIGASLLLYTPHRAIAGPYHRNTGGNLLLIQVMLAPPEEARTLLERHGVTHVADCLNAADGFEFINASPDGFQARLRDERNLAWLEPVPGTWNTPMPVYRVRR
ncbi:GtrA family protein [Oricola cellulosilytica]|uniref:GtrA family protein n=1 Tax=Oricola cellulosilytica TaxID=1429082 RepID=A0A4R0PE33_9HYPH|nr:GtrA family protein [Oricola cellulosilytica]TCD16047.1 GtrA family protein [Oricola cellulosilytica]